MNEVTRPAGTSLVDGLMKLIADQNVGTDKLELLLKMQAQALETRAREEFHQAFADLSAELPQVEREGRVELSRDNKRLGGYRYARWEDMDTVIRPVLAKHGFGLSFSSRIAPDHTNVILKGKLLHVGGYFEEAEFPVLSDKGPGRNDLQARGSGISYAKRYVAEMLLNVVRKGEDDDGIAALSRKISEKQVENLERLIAAAKSTPEKFLRVMVTGVESIADIPERDYERVINALNMTITRNAKKRTDKE